MTSVNPYSPPQAVVSDIGPDRFSQPQVWAWRGRIGRLRYLAYLMGGYLALFGLILAATLVSGGDEGLLVSAATIVGGLTYLVLSILSTIQRSHDMDWSGWTALGLLIPFVNLIWLFKSGSAGHNRFGHPPPPNTLGVKLLAWTMPAVVVLGIVAAIAIPAFVDYQKRAAAAAGK